MGSDVLIERNNSKNLLVSFGGLKQGIGMPVFEFNNCLKSIDCDKIFIRDNKRAWYHKGIENRDVDNILSIRDFLKYQIESNKYSKIIFLGNSMGGYAALLFGSLLTVNKVIAFSPQTFIGKIKRVYLGDKRWSNYIAEIYSNNASQKKYYDLKKIIKNEKFGTFFHIYYSLTDKLDKIHAERLRKKENVTLFPYKVGGHQVIKHLRDNGMLEEILKEAFSEEQQ